jgi:hypothetical protein
MFLHHICPDLITVVINYIQPPKLMKLMVLDKTWYKIINDDRLWLELYKTKHPNFDLKKHYFSLELIYIHTGGHAIHNYESGVVKNIKELHANIERLLPNDTLDDFFRPNTSMNQFLKDAMKTCYKCGFVFLPCKCGTRNQMEGFILKKLNL